MQQVGPFLLLDLAPNAGISIREKEKERINAAFYERLPAVRKYYAQSGKETLYAAKHEHFQFSTLFF